VKEQNGVAPAQSPESHVRWCRKFSDPMFPICTCTPIPALRCDECRAVFSPAEGETPIGFEKRVMLHAMVHPEPPRFTQGTVGRQRGETPPSEGIS
jgi:hypothetical protein